MITNKDVRVENGNIVINGDKYPLDGQSPEAIMQIVKDNSDTTPTENSTAPITSGGVFTANKTISDTIGDITQTGLTGVSVAEQLTTAKNQIANKIKIVSVTVTTSADGIGDVFYNSDIKRGKVIGVYLDNPASTYRFCTMMVNNVSDRFYIFAYNYNLSVIANTAVTIHVVCYD